MCVCVCVRVYTVVPDTFIAVHTLPRVCVYIYIYTSSGGYLPLVTMVTVMTTEGRVIYIYRTCGTVITWFCRILTACLSCVACHSSTIIMVYCQYKLNSVNTER